MLSMNDGLDGFHPRLKPLSASVRELVAVADRSGKGSSDGEMDCGVGLSTSPFS